MRRLILLTIIFCLSLTTHAGDQNFYYVIKANDVVSQILFRANLTPIYGKSGKLFILKQVNSQNINDINSLTLNQKLYFPDDLANEALHLGQLEVKGKNELVFKDNPSQPNRLADEKQQLNGLAKEKSQIIRRTVAEDSSVPLEKTKVEDIPKAPETEKPIYAKVEESAQSRFIFSLGSGYSRVDSIMDSTGATAVMLSRPLMSTDLKWEQIWSEVYESFFHFTYASIPYQEANQGQVFDNHPSVSSTSFGMKYNFHHPGKILFEVGVSEELIVASYQTGTATIEVKPLAFFKSVYSKDVLEVKKLKLTLGLGASYFLNSTFGNNTINAATKYSGQLQITQKFKNFSFFASGEFSDFLQKTTLTQQERRDLTGNLGFIIPLGENQP